VSVVQYSLDWFIDLFEQSIESTDTTTPRITSHATLYKSQKLDARIEALNKTFTQILYTSICRSLFEKDKLLFSTLLACKIMLAEGEV
jgi:dynein heavy chain